MARIEASVPDELIAALDAAAARLERSRSELICFAIETYLEDLEDIEIAVQRSNDPCEEPLDWEEVRSGLLGTS